MFPIAPIASHPSCGFRRDSAQSNPAWILHTGSRGPVYVVFLQQGEGAPHLVARPHQDLPGLPAALHLHARPELAPLVQEDLETLSEVILVVQILVSTWKYKWTNGPYSQEAQLR